MLYKDILSNNQGIKEVRCANDVIWRKKVEQLLRLKYSSSYNRPFLSHMEVKDNYIYAIIGLDNDHSSVAKIKIDNGKLSLVNYVIIKSVSTVLVVDPKIDGIIYVVGYKNESGVYNNLLCIDTNGNTWKMKSLNEINVKNCYSFGCSDIGILLCNGFDLFFFEYETTIPSFDYVKASVKKFDIPSYIGNFITFSKNNNDSMILYMAIPRTSQNNWNQMLGVMYKDSFLKRVAIPFGRIDGKSSVIENISNYKFNSYTTGPMFVSREGFVYLFDRNKVELFDNYNSTTYDKITSYDFKLQDCGAGAFYCIFDPNSNILTVWTRSNDYDQTKKEFIKAYLIDYNNKSSNKNLYPIWTKEFTNEKLSLFFYGSNDVLIHSRESDNDNEIIFGYETLVRPTPPTSNL